MNPAPPVMSNVDMKNEKRKTVNEERSYSTFCVFRFSLNRCSLGILQCEPEFFCERIDRRAAALPRAVGLEPEIADTAAPRRDHAADGAEVASIRMLLVETPDDVRSDANEGAQRGCRADAVLAAVPGAAEDKRDLLEVVDEELPRL